MSEKRIPDDINAMIAGYLADRDVLYWEVPGVCRSVARQQEREIAEYRNEATRIGKLVCEPVVSFAIFAQGAIIVRTTTREIPAARDRNKLCRWAAGMKGP